MSDKISDKASDRKLLSNIAGYEDALKAQNELAKTGTDLTEKNWEVSNTIAKLHPKRITLEVSEIIEDTPSTKTFRLISTGAPLPPFQAGQYINLFVNIDGVETARPYAISSSPSARNYYDLTVKRVADGFVTHYLLDQVKVGQQLLSTGPMGTFYHNPIHHGEELVFLAGGSGIAPARSMLLDVLDQNKGYNFHFIYASSYVDDVIFKDELRELADKYDNFTLTEVISRPPEGYEGLTGHLNADLIKELLGEPTEKMYYVCGPTPFHDFCEAQLLSLGVPARRIRIEANGAPKNPKTLPGWPEPVEEEKEVTVTIQGQGSFKAKAGEPLLNSMERNGYSAENACRSGECSLCRCKLVSGDVYNPPESLLRSSDKQFGWIHSCVAFPTEDIEIVL